MHGAEPQVNEPSAAQRPLVWVTLAAVLGIVADRYLVAGQHGGLIFWWLATAIMIVGCAVLHRSNIYRGTSYLVLLAILSLTGAWHHLHWNYFTDDSLARFASSAPQPVCVEAIAIDRIKTTPVPPHNPLRALPARQRSGIEIRIARIRDGTHWRAASGECRLRVTGQLTEVNTGDRLRVFAHFARPRPALNPGQYDWSQAQRAAGRHCELFCAATQCVSVIQPANFMATVGWFDTLAAKCSSQLAYYIGPEQSALALAILLGQRESLNADTQEAFFRTGTVHLLVVSGLHIGMLAGVVLVIVRSGVVSKKWAIIITAILVITYAAIAGGRPPVVRATVLIVLALFALLSWRRTTLANLLAAAAIGVLAYNPSELFRSGTQLSFLCVAALAAYGAHVSRAKPIDPLTRLIREYEPAPIKVLRKIGQYYGHLVIASVVVWFAAAPLVAFHFNIATPVGILITPLIWPLVAITLASGLAICTIGWVLPPVAALLGAVSAFCLRLMQSVITLANQIEIGSLYLPGPPVWWLLIFYTAAVLFLLNPFRHLGWKIQLSAAALWIAVGLAVATSHRHNDQLRCTFLAVGHGTCVVLELPNDQTILYDAGSLGSPEFAADTIAAYLWSRGITRIDAVVLSHADVDHYNAVPELFERFDLGVVYVSPLMFDPWSTQGKLDAPEFLRRKLEAANIPLHEVWMNDRLRTNNPEIDIQVLHPPRFGTGGEDNSNSILLHVRYAGSSILLPGDLESPGIEAVTAEAPLDCNILLAPHHGSSRSDPPGFAAWSTPDWVVVSGGHPGDDQQLTSASYRAVGAQVLHTATRGAATFTLDSAGIDMSTFRKIDY